MIVDTQGRKWRLRFTQYPQGWHWAARYKKQLGMESSMTFFKTKALAEEDARRALRERDVVAQPQQFFRRVRKRGAPCQLTEADHEAIKRAGTE